MPRITSALAIPVIVTLLSLRPTSTDAQSLRGSGSSVLRMYAEAVREGLPFYETTNSVRFAVMRGELVKLNSGSDYDMHRVAFPYVRPATLDFVERLADRYEAGCGETLVVTSGVRPESRQPRNSSTRSVHPTGMAVDLRKPDGKCLTWLRRTLLELEGEGVIEATEEHHPPHFHVAVFESDYNRYASRTFERPTAMLVARVGGSSTYRVRVGDSLWSIAQDHDTSVRELIAANKLGRTTIRPGQTLVIPVH